MCEFSGRNESRIEPVTSTVSGSATATTVEGGEQKTSDHGITVRHSHYGSTCVI